VRKKIVLLHTQEEKKEGKIECLDSNGADLQIRIGLEIE
jgi:hypothetical protein